MTTTDFVRGLVRLTAMAMQPGNRACARWRAPRRLVPGLPNLRAYLAFGPYTFVLDTGGEHPRLIERGDANRRPTVLAAPREVQMLATMVQGQLKEKIIEPDVLDSEEQVPVGWAELMTHARRIKTTEEELRDERELWRRVAEGDEGEAGTEQTAGEKAAGKPRKRR